MPLFEAGVPHSPTRKAHLLITSKLSTQQNKDSNQARATPPPANPTSPTLNNNQSIDDMWTEFDKSVEELFAQNDAGFDDVSLPLYTGPSMTSPEIEMTGAVGVAGSRPSNRTADSTARTVAADANMPSTHDGLTSASAGTIDLSRVAAYAKECENAKRIYAHRRAEYESGPPNVFQQVTRGSQESTSRYAGFAIDAYGNSDRALGRVRDTHEEIDTSYGEGIGFEQMSPSTPHPYSNEGIGEFPCLYDLGIPVVAHLRPVPQEAPNLESFLPQGRETIGLYDDIWAANM
ncbi:hypothetical protein BJX65DRAFT_302663 [Aspergillus insuetus]